MTETSTEAVAGPQPVPPPPVEKPPEPEKTPAATGVEHTPGGWPVVPLALTSTNTTVGAIASAGLVGGPVGAAVAATGALIVGAVAATRTGRTTNTTTRKTNSRTNGTGRTSGRGQRGGTGRRIPAPTRSTPGTGSGRQSGRGLPTSRSSGGRSAVSPRGTGPVRKTPTSGVTRKRGSGAGRGAAGGRVGQVRALRRDRREQAPTRGATRTQSARARRDVADARRAAKTAARTAKTPSRGFVGRAAARIAAAAGRARDTAVNRARAARDRRTQDKLAGARDTVRKAPARRRARAALWRSAARFQGRRALAGLLATPLGVLGALTTPIGRKLGWRWLQHPGRRLYQRLMLPIREARAARNEEIRKRLTTEEAAVDAAVEGDGEIGDRVERPTHLIPRTTPAPMEDFHVSGFKFAEAAAEMEQAAQTYDPDGMEILAMVEGLPEALQSVANTFRILAERSDSEFPLEKAVANGFDDIFDALIKAVQAAEDLVPAFKNVHEQDIARHEDPRNGSEAEKKWNV